MNGRTMRSGPDVKEPRTAAPVSTRIEACHDCRRPFVVSGGAEGPLHEIACAHCRALWGVEHSAVPFRTHALTVEHENRYLRSHGGI
jgi:hypothetical protein